MLSHKLFAMATAAVSAGTEAQQPLLQVRLFSGFETQAVV